MMVQKTYVRSLPCLILFQLLLHPTPLPRAERIHALFPLSPIPNPSQPEDLVRGVPVLADPDEATLILPGKVDMRSGLPTKETMISRTGVRIVQ